jgi:hypothetical protein
LRSLERPGRARRVEPYRPFDILQRLLAEIVERKISLASDLLEGAARKAYTAWLTLVLDPCRNIDSVPEDIVGVDDDIADIDPDAERYRRNESLVPFGHLALHDHRAGNGVDGAGEFHEHTIARRLDDAPVVIGDSGIDDFAAMRLQRCQRPNFVSAHQPRITGYISRQYGSQPALHPLTCHRIVSNFPLQRGYKSTQTVFAPELAN